MVAVRAMESITDEIEAIRSAAGSRTLTDEEHGRITDLIVERAAAERVWLDRARKAYIREQREHWTPLERARFRAALRPSAVFIGLVSLVAVTGGLLAASPSESMIRPLTFVFIFSVWIASVCIHEFGHALAAYLGGDRGVAQRGYLSLDPRRYSDPLLSIILPIAFMLMGGIGLPGGSVMVERNALRSRRWDLAVSVAGPLGTLVCLVLCGLPFLVLPDSVITAGNINLFVALAGLVKLLAVVLILNLLPIPPLDGFRIASYWMPEEVAARGFALGWMPMMMLYFVLARPNPLTFAFWSASDRLSGLFLLPYGWGEYAIGLLQLA